MMSPDMKSPKATRRKASARPKTQQSSPEISIVVPVLNEEGNITPLVEGIRETFSGRAIEIIYVNDCSTDGSADELASLQQRIDCLRVLTHSERA
ncbi:MAG TPA: hypothetical protein DEQ75_02870, partial [Alphaproteobacteria bacterium]|nr:hypothetical protein [Alphaproteobacteria bacterium]